jgi:hypothetical protein
MTMNPLQPLGYAAREVLREQNTRELEAVAEKPASGLIPSLARNLRRRSLPKFAG